MHASEMSQEIGRMREIFAIFFPLLPLSTSLKMIHLSVNAYIHSGGKIRAYDESALGRRFLDRRIYSHCDSMARGKSTLFSPHMT